MRYRGDPIKITRTILNVATIILLTLSIISVQYNVFLSVLPWIKIGMILTSIGLLATIIADFRISKDEVGIITGIFTALALAIGLGALPIEEIEATWKWLIIIFGLVVAGIELKTLGV